MKKTVILFLILLQCFFFTAIAKAEQTEYTEEIVVQQIDKLPLNDIDEQIQKI